MFFLLTDLTTKLGITDERKADGRFPLGVSLVKNLPTKAESQTDGIFLSVKLWNLVVRALSDPSTWVKKFKIFQKHN